MKQILYVTLLIATVLIAYNQFQITSVKAQIDAIQPNTDLSGVNVASLASTAQSVRAVYPELHEGMSQSQIVELMVPRGAPSYSNELGGISFDQPEKSLAYLVRWYPAIKNEVKTEHPDVWQRYLDLAAHPRGISCEFCCGIGPQGIDQEGNSRCGCQHNPALQAITLGLMLNTDMSDAEVLREAIRWKTLFFPKDMVELGTSVAGADMGEIEGLPGMVGGC